ncbi:hypothetical protein J5N97_010471 [Dioscorea zingiberensis]|uniref:AtC3H46-like PABC-like domain-containing protein n=1 Tax=Dioscorea zingiberensis TaxID=325984 RepID=A0A9D5HMT5_9LILI|nr:hypothetical protein J5N97_010471 [Dioscorea zingiberensis]
MISGEKMVKVEMSLLLYMMNFSTPPNNDDQDAINKNVVEVDNNSEFLGKIIDRIMKYEPEYAFQIAGMLLLQSSGDEELYQYAYGPENILHSKISDIKVAMGIQTKMNVSAQAGIGVQNKFIHPQSLPTPYLNPHQTVSDNLEKRTNGISCYYHAKEHSLTAGLLDKVEMKTTDILKAMRGQPVSIISLTMLYYERYGRHILADAYLTGRQTYGNVTELLSQFRNSIRLIERPDGQHLVILAEDAPKYNDHGNEIIDSGSIGGSSHLIHPTFLADSLFTAKDVPKHFSRILKEQEQEKKVESKQKPTCHTEAS